MIFQIPNAESIEINTIVLDLNGTLTVRGELYPETIELIEQLKAAGYRMVLISGDIRGNAGQIAAQLGLEIFIGKSSEGKAEQMQRFDPEKTAAIGNARIDIGTFENARIRIATLQAEGIHTGIMKYVDIIVPDIRDALRLFLDPKSMSGTLRT